MISNFPLGFDKTRELVLIELYRATVDVNASDAYFSVDSIQEKIFKAQISKIYLRKVVASLGEENYLSLNSNTPALFTLTKKGIRRAENLLIKAHFDIDSGLLAINAGSHIDLATKSSEAIEISAKIDEAKEAIRQSNSIDPAVRATILEHIDIGKSLLKLKSVSKSAVNSLLLSPLKEAWKSVVEENLKLPIQAAIAFLKNFIGIE